MDFHTNTLLKFTAHPVHLNSPPYPHYSLLAPTLIAIKYPQAIHFRSVPIFLSRAQLLSPTPTRLSHYQSLSRRRRTPAPIFARNGWRVPSWSSSLARVSARARRCCSRRTSRPRVCSLALGCCGRAGSRGPLCALGDPRAPHCCGRYVLCTTPSAVSEEWIMYCTVLVLIK